MPALKNARHEKFAQAVAKGKMAGKFMALGFLLALCACQSAEGSYWSDVRTIIDRTQPKKAR